MGSELFTAGLALRAALFAALLVAGAELALHTSLYACVAVIGLAALLTLAELGRHIRTIDLTLGQALDSFQDGEPLKPRHRPLRRLATALERTGGAMAARELTLQREIHHWRALADTSPVALFVIEAGAPPRPVNRAAHALPGGPALIEALRDTAETLAGRPAGSSVLVGPPSGRRMVAVGGHWTDGTTSWQLVALHTADPTFDLVEVAAWQRLVRILAHEIMNSITPIATLADSVRPSVEAMAADHPSPRASDVAAAIEAIARRSRGLLGFVDRYRAVAALPVPHCRPFGLNELLDKVIGLLKATLDQRRITLHLDIEHPGLIAEADPDLIEHALINLILNAIDATAESGAPSVGVSVRHGDGWLRLSVSDNGQGFETEARANAFVPFFTTKPNGSGIGLTLVQQIMLAHHGTVEIEAGQPGSVVSLSLPLKAAANFT